MAVHLAPEPSGDGLLHRGSQHPNLERVVALAAQWLPPQVGLSAQRAPDFYEAYANHFACWQHRPSDKGSGKTSLVEGLNNKWRNRVSGLVRKTVCVQSLDDLQRRLWIVIETHNQLCLKQIEKLLVSTL